MFGLSINYMCRVYNPLTENGNENKFRFDVCFREDLIFTDGKLYDSIIDCNIALCDFLGKLADYDHRKLKNPLILSDFSFYDPYK